MRVLVTGANGAMGSYVGKALLAAGHDVIGFSRAEPTRPDPELARVTWLRGDIRDGDALTEACCDMKVERILHLAAVLVQSDAEPVLAVETNVTGTLNVVEAAVRCGADRVVYMSTKAVLGEFLGDYGPPRYTELPEDHVPAPRSLYGATKFAAEQIGRAYHERGLVEFVSVRAGTTVGPNKGLRHGATRIVSDMFDAVLAGRPFEIRSGGDQPDDIIYNADVARGLVMLCGAEVLRHSIYHLSTGRLTTLRDIAAALREAVPGAEIAVGAGLDPFGLGYSGYGVIAASRAREDAGFEAEFAFPRWVTAYLEDPGQ